ncbi:MAG TPA: sulfotransferase [Vicinamibacteria bacterium]
MTRARVLISGVTAGPPGDGLLAGHVDYPHAGVEERAYLLQVTGWVLHRLGPPSVEVRAGREIRARAPVDRPRPDIAKAYPQAAEADLCGFSTIVNTLDLPRSFELRVEVTAVGCAPATLAVIQGARAPLPGRAAVPAPLMVTGLGRSGTSYLLLLLGSHPQVVVPPPFPYEMRVGSYWTSVLDALTRPESYLQQIATRRYGRWWWLADPGFRVEDYMALHAGRWLAGEGVDGVAGLCGERIHETCAALAAAAGKPGAGYVAEKNWPTGGGPALLRELSPCAREIVIVRDFRDVICSSLAFDARRGFAGFGRDLVASDEEYVDLMQTKAAAVAAARRRADHLVRYEDLLRDPRRTLPALFEALGVDASDRAVEEVLTSAAATEPARQQAHKTAADSIGRWKRDLAPALARRCQEVLGGVLAEFGYSD